MRGVKTKEEQKASLEKFMAFATSPTPGHCNFGAMVFMESRGDVSFLAPIHPKLRGVEIVAASPPKSTGKDYDIWRGRNLVAPDLTMVEVLAWLSQKVPSLTERDIYDNGRRWLEDVMKYYRVPKRST